MAKIVISEGPGRVDGKVELCERRKIRKGQRVAFEGRRIVVK